MGKLKRFLYCSVFIALLAGLNEAQATHLRAGEIIVKRQNCTGLLFIVTIRVYVNTGSPINFGGDGVLDFGDGESIIVPELTSIPRPDLGEGIGYVEYSTTHTFPGPGRYVVSYLEPNRNAGILNMTNSVDTRFYIETAINIDPFLGCNQSTPDLLVPPVDKACTGGAWYHNPGAFDLDGDSLSYEFITPKQARGIFVNGYRDPNSRDFYDRVGIPYNQANENQNGPPTFTINPVTGTIIWDSPGAPGEYNIAFLIKEWRKIGGIWVLIGFVTRDMQIEVEDCLNQRPEINVPIDTCVVAGSTLVNNNDIYATDPDNVPTRRDSLKIEAFSDVFARGAVFAPTPVKFRWPAADGKVRSTFSWQTECADVKEQPYQVVFKVTDKSSRGPSLAQFKTWRIKVVGPAPEWQAPPTVNVTTRFATLTWKPYVCTNAARIQIWRKIDTSTIPFSACITGMPPGFGFELIATVPRSATTFVDQNGGQGLAPGASYCYRLVAEFPQPAGGLSYVSDEVCTPTIESVAPVVTNVTIDRTNNTNGQVTVKWAEPLDAPVTFVKPYRYRVLRSNGFSGNVGLVAAHPGLLSDTTFTEQALNTRDNIYNYRVIAFDNNGQLMDTSATASTVRLELATGFKRITLNWNAFVPWSNRANDLAFPKHLIFRGPAGATEAQMVLIDSVNVNQRYQYVDSGQYNAQPLREDQEYCYRVETRGSYGNNPALPKPLKNFSQIICGQPSDDQPPCAVEITATGTRCEEFISSVPCETGDGSSFPYSNVLSWKRPLEARCYTDVRGYNIYMAPVKGGDFVLYRENVPDTFFIDFNLPSFARCYKVTAVDRAGNESERSEEFCFDNCPQYKLPNVFTPNGDGCNDLFSAYSERFKIPGSEPPATPCGLINENEIRTSCPRFVRSVSFSVYNRWGKEVYKYESGGEKNVYIDWNGKDNSGRDLADGVYYYTADIVFDVVDPARQNQTIKGWVQIVR